MTISSPLVGLPTVLKLSSFNPAASADFSSQRVDKDADMSECRMHDAQIRSDASRIAEPTPQRLVQFCALVVDIRLRLLFPLWSLRAASVRAKPRERSVADTRVTRIARYADCVYTCVITGRGNDSKVVFTVQPRAVSSYGGGIKIVCARALL